MYLRQDVVSIILWKGARCRAKRKVQVIFLIKYADTDSQYILVVENTVEYGDKHEIWDGEDISGDLVHEHDLLPAEPVPAAHLHLLLGAVQQLVDQRELYEAEEHEHDGGRHPHVNCLNTQMLLYITFLTILYQSYQSSSSSDNLTGIASS